METEVLPEEKVKTQLDHKWMIILHNDDHNSFDHVIECLIKYCQHTVYQAEQCAQIVHFNGKTDVKRGDIYTLRPVYEALIDNDLTVTMEEV